MTKKHISMIICRFVFFADEVNSKAFCYANERRRSSYRFYFLIICFHPVWSILCGRIDGNVLFPNGWLG